MVFYLVERSYLSSTEHSAACNSGRAMSGTHVVETDESAHVIWLVSFVSLDGLKEFCLYAGPSPEALRQDSELNNLPVDRISRVKLVLAPTAG